MNIEKLKQLSIKLIIVIIITYIYFKIFYWYYENLFIDNYKWCIKKWIRNDCEIPKLNALKASIPVTIIPSLLTSFFTIKYKKQISMLITRKNIIISIILIILFSIYTNIYEEIFYYIYSDVLGRCIKIDIGLNCSEAVIESRKISFISTIITSTLSLYIINNKYNKLIDFIKYIFIKKRIIGITILLLSLNLTWIYFSEFLFAITQPNITYEINWKFFEWYSEEFYSYEIITRISYFFIILYNILFTRYIIKNIESIIKIYIWLTIIIISTLSLYFINTIYFLQPIYIILITFLVIIWLVKNIKINSNNK